MKKNINEAENGKLTGLTPLTSAKNQQLNSEAAKAYEQMVDAAKKDGVTWTVTDSYRDYDTQNRIFDWDYYKKTKKRRKKGTSGTPVAYPGTSNHGWGSALDLGVKYGDKAHTWLVQNASKFGFSNPFKNPRTEPWHWEHLQSARNMGSTSTGGNTTTDDSTTDSQSQHVVDKVSDSSELMKAFQAADEKFYGQSLKEEINRIKKLIK